MKSNRLKSAMLNSAILTLIQVFTILLRFANQTIFIQTLGKQFLGLNGLFTNILSFLSFAELGIGTSIIFSLYKPLAENNEQKISALMNFIRKAYYLIGIAVGVIGLALVPFLPIFIKDYHVVDNIPLFYILYLSNSVISYFYTYKRSILIADQHEYISSINTFIYLVVQTLLQIILLFKYHSYGAYLIIAVICTLVSNIAISRSVDKRYPYLKKNSKLKIDKDEARSIRNNIIGMVGSRVGRIVISSTDNILLSTFLGLSIVGLYSNYLLIVTSVSAILNKLVGSVTASIGNLITENDQQRSYFIFRAHFMLNLFLVSITTVCLLVALNPFISVWAGKNYLLSGTTVIVIVLNYFIDQIRQTSLTFISAYGLFVPNGKKSIVEAIMNLILSLTFLRVFNLNISGVLLGTLLTNLLLNSWWEPLLLFRKGFGFRSKFTKFYIGEYLRNVIFLGVCVFLINWLLQYGDTFLSLNNLLIAAINAVTAAILMLIIIFIFYHKNDGFKYVLDILAPLLKRLKKNS